MRGALLRLVLLAIILVPQLRAQSASAAEPPKCNPDTTEWGNKDNPGATPVEQGAWDKILHGQIAKFAKSKSDTPDGTRQEEEFRNHGRHAFSAADLSRRFSVTSGASKSRQKG